MAQYMTSPGPKPDPDAMAMAASAARPWLTRTALGAPVDPDVNNRRYSVSGDGGTASSPGASSPGVSSASALVAPPPAAAAETSSVYSSVSDTRTRTASTPMSRPSSNPVWSVAVTTS